MRLIGKKQAAAVIVLAVWSLTPPASAQEGYNESGTAPDLEQAPAPTPEETQQAAQAQWLAESIEDLQAQISNLQEQVTTLSWQLYGVNAQLAGRGKSAAAEGDDSGTVGTDGAGSDDESVGAAGQVSDAEPSDTEGEF